MEDVAELRARKRRAPQSTAMPDERRFGGDGSMIIETTRIPTWTGDPQKREIARLGAAAYLAILAYPMERPKRDRFVKAYKAARVHEVLLDARVRERWLQREH